MKHIKKCLSIMLSFVIVITSIITVFPIAHAETITNYDVSEESLENVETSEDYYENLNDLVPGEDYIEGEMIVKYSPTTNSQTLDDLVEEFELTIECDLEEEPNAFDTLSVNDSTDTEGLYVLSFDEKTSVVDLVHEVSAFEEVEYAQPNYIYETCEATPSYTVISEKEAKGEQSQRAMWNTLNVSPEMPTGNGVVVAVIDSGIDLSHPALEGCFWNDNGVVGYNSYTKTEITLSDDTIYTSDHGTHVAGIIAMQQSDTYTCKGIAPDVQIMDLQASYPTGGFSTTTLVRAIDWALEHNADVINMSLGSPNFDPTLNLTCNKAARKAVIVAAAGNDGGDRYTRYPAMFKSVISVMAYGGSPYAHHYPGNINNNEALLNANYPATGLMTMSWSSNFDSQENYYDIIAPGVNICSTKARTKDPQTGSISSVFEYVFMSGTSMASPFVAGAVAIYMEANPNATPGQIRDAFRQDSGKKVKKYEALSVDDEVVVEEQLLSNQLDITHILSVVPDEEIDSPYSGPNDESFTAFCDFIKQQFNNDFAEDEVITNEDLRLISFLHFTSTDSIRYCADYLSEFYNLIGIKFSGNEINDEDIDIVTKDNSFEKLEILQLDKTKVEILELPAAFCPNLYSLTADSNPNLRSVSGSSLLSNLSYLSMKNCAINDISFLSSAHKINKIYLDDNCITNIDPLSNKNNLEVLYIRSNSITDISPLDNLEKLSYVFVDDNLVTTIGDILLLENLRWLYLNNNLLQAKETDIENTINSKEIMGHWLSTFNLRPFKTVVFAEKIVGYDMCIKRTDEYVKPDVQVFPYDATFRHSVNISSDDDVVYLNPHSKTISYNENYQNEQANLSVNGTVNYECDGLTGSFDVSFLMPAIESINLEKYTFDDSVNENYISIVTTIDTTKIKTKQVNHNAKEYDLLDHNVTYKDYGNERIIKILLDENYDLTKEIDVSTGDKLGYFDLKTINESNTVNINVVESNVTNIFGSTEKLFLEGLQITAISNNAINSNCNIGTLVLSHNIDNIAASAFNGCIVSELYIKNKDTIVTGNIFNNCPNMLVYVSNDSPIKNFTGAIINSEFKYRLIEDTNSLELVNYFGNAENVVIPRYLGITRIGEGAFRENHSISSIDLSLSINEIGKYAFYDCTYLSNIGGHLKSVDIDAYSFSKTAIENVSFSFHAGESVPTSAFAECNLLTTVSVESDSSVSLQSGAFKNCGSLMFINIETPNSVTVFSSCFENCESLKTFNTVDYTVSVYGNKVFKNCKELSGSLIWSGSTIYEETFYNCKKITSIHCPKTTTIRARAFYGADALLEIGLSAQNNKCYDNSFDGCNENLIVYSNGNINNSTTGNVFSSNVITIRSGFSIEKNTYGNLMLVEYTGQEENIIIPESLKIYEIGPNVFKENNTVKSVYISSSVHNIDESAFSSCVNLKELDGGNNVMFIRANAFYNCPQLENISCFNAVFYIGEYAFAFTGIDKYDAPCSLSLCNEGAFSNCENLIEFNFSSRLTSIPKKCFYNCSSLERCVLNYNLTSILDDAFGLCNALEQLYIPLSITKISANSLPENTKIYCESNAPILSMVPNYSLSNELYPNYEIVNGVLLDYQSDLGYDYLGVNNKRVVEVPNATREIDDFVFGNNKKIDEVVLSDYTKVIGDRSFMDCSVSDITMPSEMTSIGVSAFNRTKIKTMHIPTGITKIGDFFMHGTPVQNVYIPDTVTEIGEKAFGNCSKLRNLFISDNVTSIDPAAFEGSTHPITLFGENNTYLNQYVSAQSEQNNNNILICRLGYHITDGVLTAYSGNDVNIQIPFGIGIESIADEVFKNNLTVETISIASGVTSIGAECFSGCTSLTAMVVPEDVVSVEEDAFNNIQNLTIYCNDNSYIEEYCLENGIITNTDYDISDGVLNDYNGTESNVIIPSDLCITEVGDEAFVYNSTIINVIVPEGVGLLGRTSFGYCSALKTITLPTSNSVIVSPYTFAACNKMTTVYNSTSISQIDPYAFYCCVKLEAMDLSNVKKISYNAFDNCTGLPEVTLGTLVTSIGDKAFRNCGSLLIKCYDNTYAYRYAVNNNIPYVLLDTTMMTTTIPLDLFANTHTSEVNSSTSVDESTHNIAEDVLYNYIQQEYNGEMTLDDIDDITTYMVDNGWW